MRNTLLLALTCSLFCSITPPPVTDCQENPTAMIDLEGNGIRARLTTGGDLWFDGSNGSYYVSEDGNPPTLNAPSAVFAGGLWMAGQDPGGNIKMGAQQYGRFSGRFDYSTGPLDENGNSSTDCFQWDRFWRVTSEELRSYFNDFNPNSPDLNAIPASFLAWPGAGNPFFEGENGFPLPASTQGYAPFFDVNEDGVYNPEDGDYPLFCGDQAIWCIFNNSGVNDESGAPSATQTEIHLLAYLYEAAPDNPLRYTTFYDYTIINRGVEDLLDFHAGLWIDFDLGCFTDDYLGSIPENNLVYVHNDRGTDRPFCDGGVESFTTPGVVQIAQVVNASVAEDEPLLSSFSTIANAGIGAPPPGVTDPNTASEFYNYMQGLWRDGSPVTRGGDGYQETGDITRYAYDGGATSNGTPWLSCVENVGFRDLRGVLSTGPYNLQPQETVTFTVAMTTVFDVDFPNTICPDTAPIVATAATIKDVYDGFCSPDGLVNTDDVDALMVNASVYPNPAGDMVTFEVPAEERISTIELYNAAGQLLTTVPANGNVQTISLNDIVDSPGVYLYRIRTDSGTVAIGRVLLVR